MDGIAPETYFIAKTVLTPESQCLIAELVGEYVNDIRVLRLRGNLLRGVATLCSKQGQAPEQ